ncbi:hypothetical protein Hypma_001775 [Hypsizygus marmoreus]|uniref:Uncharacterized protein n=1 Tax=Hypsizygus marmoreus TaxID=39966 RepID=A0A369J526_HYPMA|nr:hypothetical protein Hypma_001775 [Hypsizygus marmoreus]
MLRDVQTELTLTIRNSQTTLLSAIENLTNLTPAPSSKASHTSQLPVPSRNQSDLPGIKFWTKKDYLAIRNTRGSSTGFKASDEDSNKMSWYVETEDGNPASKDMIETIRAFAQTIWQYLLDNSLHPRTWTEVNLVAHNYYEHHMCERFPQLSYGANNWKAHMIATDNYPSWYGKHVGRTSKVKNEPIPSKILKRSPSPATHDDRGKKKARTTTAPRTTATGGGTTAMALGTTTMAGGTTTTGGGTTVVASGATAAASGMTTTAGGATATASGTTTTASGTTATASGTTTMAGGTTAMASGTTTTTTIAGGTTMASEMTATAGTTAMLRNDDDGFRNDDDGFRNDGGSWRNNGDGFRNNDDGFRNNDDTSGIDNDTSRNATTPPGTTLTPPEVMPTTLDETTTHPEATPTQDLCAEEQGSRGAFKPKDPL